MERFINWNIRVWIAIHLAFTLTQLTYTYLLTDDSRSPLNGAVNLLDYMSQYNRGAGVSTATSSPEFASPPTASSSISFFTNADGSFRASDFTVDEDGDSDSVDVIKDTLCRISFLSRVLTFVYSLFTLSYPFMDIIEADVTDEARGGTDLGLPILWFLQACQLYATISGAMLSFYIAVMAFRSGIIGSYITALTSGNIGAIAGTAALGALGSTTLLGWLSRLLGCG